MIILPCRLDCWYSHDIRVLESFHYEYWKVGTQKYLQDIRNGTVLTCIAYGLQNPVQIGFVASILVANKVEPMLWDPMNGTIRYYCCGRKEEHLLCKTRVGKEDSWLEEIRSLYTCRSFGYFVKTRLMYSTLY